LHIRREHAGRGASDRTQTQVFLQSWEPGVQIITKLTEPIFPLHMPNRIVAVYLRFCDKTLYSAFVEFVGSNLKFSHHCCAFNYRPTKDGSQVFLYAVSVPNFAFRRRRFVT
jgi:hypothetical protein